MHLRSSIKPGESTKWDETKETLISAKHRQMLGCAEIKHWEIREIQNKCALSPTLSIAIQINITPLFSKYIQNWGMALQGLVQVQVLQIKIITDFIVADLGYTEVVIGHLSPINLLMMNFCL